MRASPDRRVGVLTFHRCINYGSYWQARCLVEGLRAGGHDAVILDHASPRIDRVEWKCALQPTGPRSRDDRFAYRRKIRRFFDAVDGLPLSPRFPLDTPEHMPDCGTVVVGSDEVWNLAHPWYGGHPLFYGEGVRARQLVSYAASFGCQDPRGGLDPAWSGRLRNFRLISVRDAVSRSFVARAIGLEPDVVLDPVLQFPPCPGTDGIDARPDGRYAAVYGHDFTPEFAARMRRWARRRDLPLVSIGYRNDWADAHRIDAGPREFAQLIAGAEAVATNFFHGCVFSLVLRRPFVCEGSWYRSSKLRCLLAQVGGRRRLLAPDAPEDACEPLLDMPASARTYRRIDRLRRASQDYLERAVAPLAQPA